MRHLRSLLSVLVVVAFVTGGRSQGPVCVDYSLVNTTLDLPYFRARFPDIPIVTPTRNPYLGGRNVSYCCIRALNDYLRNNCTDVDQIHVEDRALVPGAQMPCGAEWIGDVNGAAEVQVTYNWTRSYCYGWQLSEASKVSEWAHLLVSFILPSVVFSFNIPRPRKLRIWNKLLPQEISSYRGLTVVPGFIGAAVIVTIDTVVWLIICFTFAGPLLLSGLYEAELDKRVLAYLQEHIKHDKLPIALRARILFSILCGNLDMYPAWSDTMDLAKHLDQLDRRSPEFARVILPKPSIQVTQPQTNNYDPLLADTRSLDTSRTPSRVVDFDPFWTNPQRNSIDESRDTDLLRPNFDDSKQEYLGVTTYDRTKAQSYLSDDLSLRRTQTASSAADTEPRSSLELESVRGISQSYNRTKTIRKVTVRLRAMLSCQYSAGTTIGGPVVFFLGSFIYTLLEIKQYTGDENIAEALAFGLWWVIIPHVAVVACLLLAGNNPNILEGIVSIRDDRYSVGESLVDNKLERRTTVGSVVTTRMSNAEPDKSFYSKVMEKVYQAEYTPAWMWDRGKCKQDWLLVLFTDAWLKYQRDDGLPIEIQKGLENFLVDAIMLNVRDWVFLWAFAFLLIFIPCLFSYLTAYYTPEIGNACRSLTFLVYTGAQTLLLLLWAYYLTWRDKYWATAWSIRRVLRGRGKFRSVGSLKQLIAKLKSQAERDTNKTVPGEEPRDAVAIFDETHPIVKVLFYVLCAIGCLVSLFTSIGGTLFQIIGIYRNSLCLMNASKWTHATRSDTYVTLSTNTEEAIREARKSWIIIGSFSVIFLGIVCYIGWWYQKGLRRKFKKIAGQIDGKRERNE